MDRDVVGKEKKLIGDVLSGDTEKFRELVELYQAEIYGLIVRQVADQMTAEDLSQESFLRAFRALPGFKFQSSFKTWITRIALNVTNSYFASRAYKERGRQVPLEAEKHDMVAADYDLTVEKKLRRLQAAIGTLAPKYRTVVALCVLEERTYQEASEILGIPSGTVGSRIHTALALLHSKLHEEEENEAA